MSSTHRGTCPQAVQASARSRETWKLPLVPQPSAPSKPGALTCWSPQAEKGGMEAIIACILLFLWRSSSFLCSLDCWFDVLIEAEDIGRIVPVLEGDQPLVVDTVGRADPLFPFVTQKVCVDAL